VPTVHPSFSDALLFLRGSSVQVEGPILLVTASELRLPVPCLSQMRVDRYPRSLDNVEDVVVGGGLSGPKSRAHSLTPEVLSSLQVVLSCIHVRWSTHFLPSPRTAQTRPPRVWKAAKRGSESCRQSSIDWTAYNLDSLRTNMYLGDPKFALPGDYVIEREC
jgi:hypothetical protein